MKQGYLKILNGSLTKKLSIVLCLGALACAPLKIFNDDPDQYEQRPPDANGEFTPFAINDRIISETRYNIQVYPVHTFLGFGEQRPICSGEAIVKLHYPEPRFEITPKSFKITCIGLPLTPNQIQPSTAQPLDGRGPGKGRLSSTIKSHACLQPGGCNDADGKKKNLLIMNFEPAIPYYLPSIVQDPAELDRLKELKQVHKVTFSDGRPEVIGSSRVKIINSKAKMKTFQAETTTANPEDEADLDAQAVGSNFVFDVVHWERELTGFDDYPIEIGGILPMIGYKHMEWWSSLRPIAMVKFRIRSVLKSVLGSDYINSLDEQKRKIINAFKDTEVILQFHMISFNEM